MTEAASEARLRACLQGIHVLFHFKLLQRCYVRTRPSVPPRVISPVSCPRPSLTCSITVPAVPLPVPSPCVEAAPAARSVRQAIYSSVPRLALVEQDEWVPPELFCPRLADGDGHQQSPPSPLQLAYLCPALRDAQPACWTARTADLRTATAGQVITTESAGQVRSPLWVCRSGHHHWVCMSGQVTVTESAGQVTTTGLDL